MSTLRYSYIENQKINSINEYECFNKYHEFKKIKTDAFFKTNFQEALVFIFQNTKFIRTIDIFPIY